MFFGVVLSYLILLFEKFCSGFFFLIKVVYVYWYVIGFLKWERGEG